MEDLLKTISDKLSSYNFFNYLFPGAVFGIVSKYVSCFNLFFDSWVENIVICYLVGMVLSRIGSIIVEPILKKIKRKDKQLNKKVPVLNYAPYSEYKEAKEHDNSIEILLEVNNMYRTLVATFLALFIFKIILTIPSFINSTYQITINELGSYFLFIGLLILFIYSFIKQTEFIYKSVKHYIEKDK